MHIGIVMGSTSDWKTMKKACLVLDEFNLSYDVDIVSAHRTPDRLWHYAKEIKDKGYKVIIAGAGGAAHLPGMVASLTEVPVFGVPIETSFLGGQDSLLSIVQMPFGIPVATFSIGEKGAGNAALMAVAVLATHDTQLAIHLKQWRQKQTDSVCRKIPNDNYGDEIK